MGTADYVRPIRCAPASIRFTPSAATEIILFADAKSKLSFINIILELSGIDLDIDRYLSSIEIIIISYKLLYVLLYSYIGHKLLHTFSEAPAGSAYSTVKIDNLLKRLYRAIESESFASMANWTASNGPPKCWRSAPTSQKCRLT